LVVYYKSKTVTYFIPNRKTDNEKMIMAARDLNLKKWPSLMHRSNLSRGQLREFWVMSLALLIQKFNFKTCEATNVALSLVAHTLSTLSLYVICNDFIAPVFSFVVSLLYLFSSWTYQVALYAGHVILAQMWFSFSIVLLNIYSLSENLIFIALSSVCIAISFFSSSASRKYPYLWVSLVFILDSIHILENNYKINYNKNNLLILSVYFLVLMSFFLYKKYFTKYFIKVLKTFVGPELKSTIESKPDIHLALVKLFFMSMAVPLLWIMSSPDIRVIMLAVILSLCLVSYYVLGPDLISGLRRYRNFLKIGNWANHFQVYESNSQTVFGRTIPKNFKGASFSWFYKFQSLVSPVIFYSYCLNLILTTGIVVLNFTINSAMQMFSIFIVSIMPVIVHNLTGAIQVGKAYYSQISGYILYLIFSIQLLDFYYNLNLMIIGYLSLLLLWSIYSLTSKILPELLICRSSVDHLRKYLIEHNILNFSTYRTPYNESLVGVLEHEDVENLFNIRFYDSIKDSSDQYFILPNRSSKSVAMESTSTAATGSDFNSDLYLLDIERSGILNDITIHKFPTIGSTRYFLSESEVTGYRFFELGQYDEIDFEKTYARIIDLKKYHNLLGKSTK